ncbi:amino acid transporter [Hypoxylon rubiginosum]|uniref:Amino acid transporter n=1 Tax=Hypoxylon rubiginosum TaxID=110542 RepID=A0ACB9YKF9_9PEZI|nr:amino acid transporter [Hypoxylon rubiginosum]
MISIIAAVAQALTSGGPRSLLYGYITAASFSAVVSASLAELASAWPTSGALYHWTTALAPPKHRPLVGFVTGYIITGTGWLGITSAMSGVAVQLQAYIILSREEYVPERWHVALIFWGFMIFGTSLHLCGHKVIKALNISAMVIHVIGYIVIIVVLLACTPEKHTAEWVFTGSQNYTGWSDGMAWCIGLLSSVYGFGGLETAAYFSEETRHASRTIPRAMFYNVVANGLITLPFIIVFLFCLGDLDSVLASPVGALSPATQIYINATGSVAGGIIMNSVATIIAFVSAVDAIGSGSRAIFAMARDNMFPSWLAVVDARFDVPVRGMMVITIPPMFIILIYIGNTTAFYGFMSVILASGMVLYTLPIGLHLFNRMQHRATLGPWNLGKLGPFINLAALMWSCFLVIVLCFPTLNPVTVENMNYASLLLGGVIILSITFWFTYGKRSGYSGVVIETDAQPINDDRSSIDDAKTAVKGETLDLHIGEGSGSAA